jgi:hypothetical protein
VRTTTTKPPDCACPRPELPLVHCPACHQNAQPGLGLFNAIPGYCQARSPFGGRCLADLVALGAMSEPLVLELQQASKSDGRKVGPR